MKENITLNNDLHIQNDSAPSLTLGKTLYISPDAEEFNYKGILGKVIQYVNMADIVGKIQVGAKYVVQIPSEHMEAFETGKYFMMQNQKTGKIWPSLMKVAEDGKNQVVTPLPIAEEYFAQGNPVQELATGYHNMLMQQQMSQLTIMMEETYRAVERIEHGQMDDRIGLLEAGKNGMLLAMTMPEGEERTMQINSSRLNLLTAQAQIGQTLQRRINEFQPISKPSSVRFIKEMRHSGYLSRKDNEVNEIQEYYDLYLQATRMIAASYTACGDLKTAEKSFEISEQTIGALDFRKIKSIEYSHSDMGKMFYHDPIKYISAEKRICMEEAKAYDYIAVEVSGENLLEAISNVRTEISKKEN